MNLDQALRIHKIPPPKEAFFVGKAPIELEPVQAAPGLFQPKETRIATEETIQAIGGPDLERIAGEGAARALAMDFNKFLFQLGVGGDPRAELAYKHLFQGNKTDLIRLIQGAALGIAKKLMEIQAKEDEAVQKQSDDAYVRAVMEAYQRGATPEELERLGKQFEETEAKFARRKGQVIEASAFGFVLSDEQRRRGVIAANAYDRAKHRVLGKLKRLGSERGKKFASIIRAHLSRSLVREAKSYFNYVRQKYGPFRVSVVVGAFPDPVTTEQAIVALAHVGAAVKNAVFAARYLAAAYYRRARMAFAIQIGSRGGHWAELSETTVEAREQRADYYSLPTSPDAGDFPIGVWTGQMAAAFTRPDARYSVFEESIGSNQTTITVGAQPIKKHITFVSGDPDQRVPARPIAEPEDVGTKLVFKRIEQALDNLLYMAQEAIERPRGNFVLRWRSMFNSEVVAFAREFISDDIEEIVADWTEEFGDEGEEVPF